jgi:aldose 1-epimerase
MEPRNFGIDHNYCINRDAGDKSLKWFGKLYHDNGRFMDCFTTEPGVQVYTANYIDNHEGLGGKKGAVYKANAGICLETQTYPDAINCDKDDPEFAKGACFILKKG